MSLNGHRRTDWRRHVTGMRQSGDDFETTKLVYRPKTVESDTLRTKALSGSIPDLGLINIGYKYPF